MAEEERKKMGNINTPKKLPDGTKAVATGFHEDTEEVVKILRRSIDAIRMKREKSKIKCSVQPITGAFLEFENCEARDKLHQIGKHAEDGIERAQNRNRTSRGRC